MGQTSVRLEAILRVLGIDPGLTRLGFGVVESVRGDLRAVTGGTITTSVSEADAERLLVLFERLSEVVEVNAPDAIAVERVFFNLNEKTAVPVMRASGVALLAAARSGAAVHEYTPLEVKQAVAGVGSATKKQVRFMVERLLRLAEPLEEPDASDALAIAICHLNSYKIREATAAR